MHTQTHAAFPVGAVSAPSVDSNGRMIEPRQWAKPIAIRMAVANYTLFELEFVKTWFPFKIISLYDRIQIKCTLLSVLKQIDGEWVSRWGGRGVMGRRFVFDSSQHSNVNAVSNRWRAHFPKCAYFPIVFSNMSCHWHRHTHTHLTHTPAQKQWNNIRLLPFWRPNSDQLSCLIDSTNKK